MNRIYLIFACFVFCFGILKSNAAVYTPDFAFPQTVSSDAENNFKRAVEQKDMSLLVQSVLAKVIADNSIDKENSSEMLCLLDSFANVVEQPYKQILYSIEAQLLTEIYNSNRRLADNRGFIKDESSVLNWNRDLFCSNIQILLNKSMENKEMLLSCKCGEYSQLLTASESEFYPSLYDVLAYRAISLISVFDRGGNVKIPFSDKKDDLQKNQMLSQLYFEKVISEFQNESEAQLCMAYVNYANRYLFAEKKIEYLMHCYEKTKNSQYSTELLSELCSQQKLPIEFAEICKKQIEKFPNYERLQVLKNWLAQQEQTIVNMQYPSLISSKTPLEVKISNVGNWIGKSVSALLYKVPDSYKSGQSAFGKNGFVQNSKFISAIEIENKETITVNFGNLSPGRYFVVPSSATSKKISPLVKSISIVEVKQTILYVGRYTNQKKSENYLLLADAFNGKPVSGVKLHITDDKNLQSQTMVTDEKGCISLSQNMPSHIKINGQYKNEKIREDVWINKYYKSGGNVKCYANIYTDLALYHPGDTVQFAAVLYRMDDEIQHVVSDKIIDAVLLDAAWQPLDTLRLESDNFGRVTGGFVLPKQALSGNFTLQIQSDKDVLNSVGVRVENYSLPTFYIDTNSMINMYKPGDIVNICGEVRTYSGMPVMDVDVAVDITYQGYIPLSKYNWRSDKLASYQVTAATDSEGKFSIQLPTTGLENTDFERGRFDVSLTVTDNAGETQQCNNWFCLGRVSSISADIPSNIEIGKSAKIDVRVRDVSGKNIVSDVEYCISKPDGEVVQKGVFNTLKQEIKEKDFFSKISSGKYRITLNVPGDSINTTTSDFVLWRSNEKIPPIESALWIPQDIVETKLGEKKIDIPVGSSYKESNILCVIYNNIGIVEKKWVELNNEVCKIRFNLPDEEGDLYIKFVTWRDGQYYTECVNVKKEDNKQQLNLKAVSFRDKIVPRRGERWVFTLDLSDKPVTDATAMVTISNKALQSIVPFSWNSDFRSRFDKIADYLDSSYAYRYINEVQYPLTSFKYLTVNLLDIPDIEMWGQSLLPQRRYASLRSNKMELSAASGVNMECSVNDEMGSGSIGVNEYARKDTDAVEGKNEFGVSEVPNNFRDAVCPLAVFNPSLVCNNSKLEIAFTVPDVNTTWQMQLLAYTPDLYSAKLVSEILASKPVMVQGNFPRFVRVGDKLKFLSTVYNNTDSILSPICAVEIFNPLNGELITQQYIDDLTIDAMHSGLFGIDFEVPDNLEMIGYRIYAKTQNYTDGEQVIIYIQPSNSVVTDTYPFYIKPCSGEYKFHITTPSIAKNCTTTLIYCDNPLWLCLTSLPAINHRSSNTSLHSRLNNLFASTVSVSIMEQYANVADSIRTWMTTRSPLLVSELKKNEQLKQMLLSQTPWSLDADAQTLRMACLYTLLDKKYSDKIIDDDIKQITESQNKDGGFGWCNGMKSSVWMTNRVLLMISRIADVKAMPQNNFLKETVIKAINWMDNEFCKEYERGAKQFDYFEFGNYLYLRNKICKKNGTDNFEKISEETIKHISKSWKKTDIYNLATVAMLLNQHGYYMCARTILESLRQRAVVKPERGMYYANIDSDYSGYGELITTTHVLKAFHAIEPDAPEIDLLRQWILLQSQTTEWGECSEIAEVIYTLLGSGSDWLKDNDNKTQIYITSREGELLLTSQPGLDEYIVLSETPSEFDIRVECNSDHPMWGGIVQKYISDNEDIAEQEISDLAITKHVFIVQGGDLINVTDGTLQVGQKVRIQLEIKSGRDMQYVTVTDGLAACLQPTDQLSGYKYIDGMQAYYEVGKENISRYIEYLPKGTHLLNYECFVTNEGEFSLPACSVQSQYAPLMSAHTRGGKLIVKEVR